MYELSEEARRDVDAILDYTLHTYGLDQAQTYYASLREKFLTLVDNPMLCREREEFSPPVRIHRHVRHLIVYLDKETGGIFIVRVLHDRMDILGHLEGQTD